MINYVIIPSPRTHGRNQGNYIFGGWDDCIILHQPDGQWIGFVGKIETGIFMVFSWSIFDSPYYPYKKIVVGCWFCCDVPLKLQKNSRIVHYSSSWLKMLLPPNRADRVRVQGPVSQRLEAFAKAVPRQCPRATKCGASPLEKHGKMGSSSQKIVKKMELDPTNDKRIGI